MLTRSQFDSACKVFVESDSNTLRDWRWVGKYPYGYLARTHRYSRPTGTDDFGDVPEEPEVDAATAVITASGTQDVISQQFVVFSASFQVPAFYFTAHHTNGVPLLLAELMESSLFKFQVPAGSEANGFALTLPDAPFPLLSQGDHPTLGTPCWYLHPCETSTAVDELFREVVEADWNEQEQHVRWMELWLMTVGGVLYL